MMDFQVTGLGPGGQNRGWSLPAWPPPQWPLTLRARLVPGGAPLTLLLSPEVVGRFLASEASSHLLVFDVEQRLPPRSELVQAVLRLFQEPVPRAALRRHERLSPRSDRARVTVQWLHVRDDGSNRTALIDSRCGGRGCGGVGLGGGKRGWARGGRRGGSVPAGTPGSGRERWPPGPPRAAPVPTPERGPVSPSGRCRRLVSIHESGWKALDVTEAVNFWQQLRSPRPPLLLQVSVQREHLGPLASSAHRLVRFAPQGPPGGRQGEPQLELQTLDLRDYG